MLGVFRNEHGSAVWEYPQESINFISGAINILSKVVIL